MSSHRQVLFHFVFGTKNRKLSIAESNAEDLYRYIWGIIKNCKGKLYRINGMQDHIHILTDLPPTLAISEYIKTIKVASSLWMKDCGKYPEFEGWQEGYGAFTHSIWEKDKMINYIKNQKEHHRSENFVDEYRRLLMEHRVDFDERYLFNDSSSVRSGH